MLDLKQGTVETLLIDVKDQLGNLSDLSTATPRFSVYREDRTEALIIEQAATVDPSEPMVARCLVNVGFDWLPGPYVLYLDFQASPDSPYLGPFPFKVNT